MDAPASEEITTETTATTDIEFDGDLSDMAHEVGCAVGTYRGALLDHGVPEEEATFLAGTLADRLWDVFLPTVTD